MSNVIDLKDLKCGIRDYYNSDGDYILRLHTTTNKKIFDEVRQSLEFKYGDEYYLYHTFITDYISPGEDFYIEWYMEIKYDKEKNTKIKRENKIKGLVD